MMAIDKQRQAMEYGDDQVIAQLERHAWLMYARERFTLDGQRERAARAEFVTKLDAVHDAMRLPARRAGVKLDFSVLRLRFVVLRSLEAGTCLYCGALMGLDQFGVVYALPPGRTSSACYGRANVVVCCGVCAAAKGSLSSDEWLNVCEVVRAAEANAGRELLEALVAGRAAVDGRRGQRYSAGAAGRG